MGATGSKDVAGFSPDNLTRSKSASVQWSKKKTPSFPSFKKGSVKKRDPVRSGSPQSEVSSAKKPAVSSLSKGKTPNGNGVQNGEKVANSRKGAPRSATSNLNKQTSSAKDGGKGDKSTVTPRADSTDASLLRETAPRTASANSSNLRTVKGTQPGAEISPNHTHSQLPDIQASVPTLDIHSPSYEEGKPIPSLRPDPEALGHLKHASLGVEALATLINHLVINYDAFSTPRLKQQLEKTKSDWIQTRLQLEQASTTYRRLEEELATERIKCKETETQFKHEIDDLRKVSRVSERRYEDLEVKVEQQEDEIDRLRQSHLEELESSSAAHHKELNKTVSQYSTAEIELKQRIDQLEKQLNDAHTAHNNLKQNQQLFIDSLSASEKETKLKFALQRNTELESEVNSLRSVLELRCSELQELRRTSQSWQLDSDQLQQAKHTINNYKVKNEQLNETLTLKETNEQQLEKENRMLKQTLSQANEHNKRLTMLNEQLTWKLKENSKLVHVLANNVDQGSYHSPVMREARRNHKISPFKASDDLISENRDWLDVPFSSPNLVNDVAKDTTPRTSPVVKGLVEKEDSVSWTLDMDEPVEYVASRIIRRATSLRCDQTQRKVQERSHSSKSMSESNIKCEIKVDNKEVIVLKDDDELDLFVGPSEITIDDARLRPKSDEELEMLRRVEESGGSLPKDLAGEAMVIGYKS